MQKVNFRNIEDFLDCLPEHELQIVEKLREIVLECIPEVTEKLAYNVPYYYGHQRICFVWPSSVPWGKVKKDGVLLGFTHGHLLQNEIGYLERGTRKYVYTKTFMSADEIDEDLLRAYIFEAVELDWQNAQKNRRW